MSMGPGSTAGRRAAAGLLAVVGAAIAGGLARTGMSFWLAAFLVFTVIGVVAFVVESRTDRVPVVGISLVVFAAVAGVVVLNTVGVPWLLSAAILVVLAFVAFWRWIAGAETDAPTEDLDKLAQRRGWQYAAQAEVPVPGPRARAWFAGVADGASVTVGRDVLTGAVNGRDVITFNLERPVGKLGQVQTIWLVRLPMPLPYLVLRAAIRRQMVQHDAPGTTDDESFARAAITPQVANALPWFPTLVWIENDYLCALVDEGNPTGFSTESTEKVIDRLATLADALPWAELEPYVQSA